MIIWSREVLKKPLLGRAVDRLVGCHGPELWRIGLAPQMSQLDFGGASWRGSLVEPILGDSRVAGGHVGVEMSYLR
jgi:hypothetical protein